MPHCHIRPGLTFSDFSLRLDRYFRRARTSPGLRSRDRHVAAGSARRWARKRVCLSRLGPRIARGDLT